MILRTYTYTAASSNDFIAFAMPSLMTLSSKAELP